jgi:DNA (cytosine-5)-methyltransferase 1
LRWAGEQAGGFAVLTFYNDNEPFVCAWMQNLMNAGLISRGVIDGRSITDIQPADVSGFNRCHFFSGLGGWDYALQLAGWPDDRPVWTASLPCQPFSVAGKRQGEWDSRHLWPAFYDFVCECKPTTIFGEQAGEKSTRAWFRQIQFDLEDLGYAVAGVRLPASCVGNRIMRQRLWWVASSENKSRSQVDSVSERHAKASKMFRVEPFPWEALPEVGGEMDDRFVTGEPHGVSRNVGAVRSIGNSIVPQVAAEFIKAYLETEGL